MNKIQKILEKLYWLKTHNKNLTKKQLFLIEEIYDELETVETRGFHGMEFFCFTEPNEDYKK